MRKDWTTDFYHPVKRKKLIGREFCNLPIFLLSLSRKDVHETVWIPPSTLPLDLFLNATAATARLLCSLNSWFSDTPNFPSLLLLLMLLLLWIALFFWRNVVASFIMTVFDSYLFYFFCLFYSIPFSSPSHRCAVSASTFVLIDDWFQMNQPHRQLV